jgi:hypothetical protein
MDFIRPIGPSDDLDQIARVERLKDQQEERERQASERKKRQAAPQPAVPPQESAPEGPVEGDDGHLHIDVRA